MSQCVPSWDLDDETTATPPLHRRSLRSHSVSMADVPLLDYEVAELTWENGQVAMHAFGPPRLLAKPSLSTAKYAGWDKPRASGTLESIVNQATSTLPLPNKPPFDPSNTVGGGGVELVTWFDDHQRAAMKRVVAAASTTGTTDALVPTPIRDQSDHHQVVEAVTVPAVIAGAGTIAVPGCSTRVESCSATTGAATNDDSAFVSSKHGGSLARVPDWSSRSQSVNNSATFGLTVESTKTSDHDSVGHSRPQRKAGDQEDRKKRSTGKSSLSTKRSRAAAIHNQSERKRRDKINQRMKTLQKMVPNSSKTDKASMLDEVIEYLKNLQAQIQMMSRMSMPPMMLPMAMQQQLQMAMMAATPSNTGMGMGMGIGMGMDMNAMGRPNIPGISSILPPTAFVPMASWDFSGGDRLRGPSTAVMPDPLSAFLACQSQQQQPMTMDAYSMMAAMYQQFHQPPASSSKS